MLKFIYIRNIKYKYTFQVVDYYFQPIPDVVYNFQYNSSAITDVSGFSVVILKKGLILVFGMIYFKTFKANR